MDRGSPYCQQISEKSIKMFNKEDKCSSKKDFYSRCSVREAKLASSKLAWVHKLIWNHKQEYRAAFSNAFKYFYIKKKWIKKEVNPVHEWHVWTQRHQWKCVFRSGEPVLLWLLFKSHGCHLVRTQNKVQEPGTWWFRVLSCSWQSSSQLRWCRKHMLPSRPHLFQGRPWRV